MALYHAELLANVHPDLVRLLTDAGQGGLDLCVVQGARTLAAEQAAIASGHSALKDPMSSKHVIGPDRPQALAVDVVPFPNPPTPEEWKDIPAFQAMGSNLKALADTIGVAITWGGDWETLKDFDHIELKEAV